MDRVASKKTDSLTLDAADEDRISGGEDDIEEGLEEVRDEPARPSKRPQGAGKSHIQRMMLRKQ